MLHNSISSLSSISLLPSLPFFKMSLPLPLGGLPRLGFIHRHLVTEAGTTGIFFTKMPQSLCPLGATPEAVFHNQVNHKQPLWSPLHPLPPPTHTRLSHTPGRAARGGLLCVPAITKSVVAAALRQAVTEGTQVSSANLTEQVHHEAAHSNATVFF